ncbi:MAG: HPF/RaiA family ribosome-associated protein [Calditrichia bacterium]
MQVPLEISYREINKTDSLESLIREKVAKLNKICDYITSCRVAVERPQKNVQTGSPYRVRVALRVPPKHELVVDRRPVDTDPHDELPTVIRDAFEVAERQLKDLMARQREDVKTHPEQAAEAVIARIFREKGYGFIRTVEGREVYFHQNSVLNNDFDRLEIGTGVRIAVEMGQDGPQASTVQIVDKPGSRIDK